MRSDHGRRAITELEVTSEHPMTVIRVDSRGVPLARLWTSEGDEVANLTYPHEEDFAGVSGDQEKPIFIADRKVVLSVLIEPKKEIT